MNECRKSIPTLELLQESPIAERHKNESGFPEIAEEEPEKFDPDDNPQMTMEARS